MTNQHKAVYLDGKDKPFRVDTIETHQPGKGEVLIRNEAIAINPVDWKIQDYGFFIKEWPAVLGEDLAGTIEAVGDGVTRFKPGQRVLAHSNYLGTGKNQEGSFQELVLVPQHAIAVIPDSMKSEDAAVLPLAVSTAAAGLFQSKDQGFLGLDAPSTSPQKSGKIILVWGGSSSVGATAIQLAVASGVQVITTASSRNKDFVEKLGAKFFDYNSPSVVGDLVAELQRGEFAGAYDAISSRESQMQSGQVVAQFGGGTLTTVLPPIDELAATVKATGVFALTVFMGEHAHVGESVWGDFLPKALASGQFVPSPPAEIVGTGIDSVADACKRQKAGVSAKKIVVKL